MGNFKFKNSYTLHFLLCVVFGVVISWLMMGYIQLEFNPLNWSKDSREGFVFIIISVIALSFPMAGVITPPD